MSDVTQKMIDKVVKNCIWRKEVHGTSICVGMANPCLRVIDRGECDTLIQLFERERIAKMILDMYPDGMLEGGDDGGKNHD